MRGKEGLQKGIGMRYDLRAVQAEEPMTVDRQGEAAVLLGGVR